MHALSRTVALVAWGMLGSVILSSCVIRFGPGEGDSDGGGGGFADSGGTGAGSGGTAPDNPPEDPFAGADPLELARMTATASYAAAATASLVETQVPDPLAIDEATFAELLGQLAPIAEDQALLWADSVDPSVFAGGVLHKVECNDPPHSCTLETFCPYLVPGGARCFVTECGTGACPYCPIFGDQVVESWCSYGCMRGSDVVGGAFKVRLKYWGERGPICFGR